MSKYVIKNCPACRQYNVFGVDDKPCCYSDMKYCQDCTDCVMKKIVQVCNEYSDKWEDCDFSNGLSDEIFKLLDIEECE